MSCGNGCGGCGEREMAAVESEIEIQEKRIQLSRAEMDMWYEAIMCQGPLVHEVIRARVQAMIDAVPETVKGDTERMAEATKISMRERHAKQRGEHN